MTLAGWFQILAILALVTAAAWALGSFMAAVFTGKRTLLIPVLAPVAAGINRLAGTQTQQEETWQASA